MAKQYNVSVFFTRNHYYSNNLFDIPVIQKQVIDTNCLHLLGYQNTNKNENFCYRQCGVHFFIDDYKFKNLIGNPPYYLNKLSQYKFLLTPDFSLYVDMPIAIQIQNVFYNRWFGAYWQEHGLLVIPTISWSNSQSFSFCFCGVEQHSTIAISTLGCKHSKTNFMRGYNKMLEVLKPDTIICYGKTFSEMTGNIITIKTTHLKQEVL